MGFQQNRYYGSNELKNLTLSARNMLNRNMTLDQVENSIPTVERVRQIHKTVTAHIIAEETNNVDATLATMTENPVYEDIASGKTYVGHQGVMDDYAAKFKSFPDMKRHITNLMIDKNGCFAEVIWEGKQKASILGIKPPSNRDKIYLPISIYFEITEDGKISRESVYYDQYLMMLNLDLIPDILNSPLTLMALNPGLMFRKE